MIGSSEFAPSSRHAAPHPLRIDSLCDDSDRRYALSRCYGLTLGIVAAVVAWIRLGPAMERRDVARARKAARPRPYRSDQGWIYRETIDLGPDEWRTEPRPGEPFFGPFLPDLLGHLAVWTIILTAASYFFR